MNFVRVKKRGQDQRLQKTWMPEGCLKHHTYRITWARELHGVRIKPRYHATVLCHRNREDFKQWDFAGRRGPYKTFEAAVEACELHEKSLLALIEASESERSGRADRMRTAEFRSRVKYVRDKKPVYQKTMISLPVWAAAKVNNTLLNFLFPPLRGTRKSEDEECDPSGPTETSLRSSSESASTSVPESSGPVLDAKAVAKSSIPTTSPATSPEPSTSSARSVKEAGKARGKRAAKRTEPELTSGSKKPKPTIGRKRSAKADSPSSLKKSA